ncbi:MAG: segregation and condensation protein A [Planctomycetota bacterium]|jgi:segregation and condensation protein A
MVNQMFAIELTEFRGPIDLLWFLVRRNEVDVNQLSLAKITSQFLEYLEVLQEIQFDSVGDFVEVASRLVELKSRTVLPRPPEEISEDDDLDPREDLVARLLLYKEFRDVATLLDEQAASWQQRYPRLQDDLPPRAIDLAEQPIQAVELWDLVSAFGRVLREQRRAQPERIFYDDTPIQVYMRRIHGLLVERGSLPFSGLFEPGMHKSSMIGVFLAVLELARHHNVRTEQADLNAEILVVPGEGFAPELRISDIDNYDSGQLKELGIDAGR